MRMIASPREKEERPEVIISPSSTMRRVIVPDIGAITVVHSCRSCCDLSRLAASSRFAAAPTLACFVNAFSSSIVSSICSRRVCASSNSAAYCLRCASNVSLSVAMFFSFSASVDFRLSIACPIALMFSSWDFIVSRCDSTSFSEVSCCDLAMLSCLCESSSAFLEMSCLSNSSLFRSCSDSAVS